MIKRILLYLYILVTCPILAFAQINTDRVMAIGRNALYFEDYVLSIQYFNQVINAKPYLADPYFYRGLAKINLDDFQGAERDCSEAIERNPFVVSAYQVRGLARIRQNNYAGAVADYEKALEFDPENIGVWHNMALCRIKQEDYRGAKNDLDKLIAISPRYTKAYLMRGEVDLRQNDTIAAENDFGKAIEIDRYDADTWASRAILRLQQQKYKDAEADFDQAIRLSTRNAGVYINRALARYHQNNLRGAMKDYDFALEIEPHNFIGHYNRGLLRAQVGDDNRAIEDFNFVIEMEPDNMMAIFNRGLLLDQIGDYKAAVRDYSAVINEYPNFLMGYQYRAQARKKMGDAKGADADEFKVLKAQLDKQNGVNQNNQTADNTEGKDRTRKKSDKNMDNYRKIVVADNEEGDEKYKSEYRGRVQDKNVTIIPQPMFALTYYERHDDVKRQVNYYKYIEELNSRKALPGRLIITNEEAPLTEEQAKKHFASIDEQTAAIVADPNDVSKRFARSLDFYLVQDFANAIEDLNQAIICSDKFFPAYFNRALIRYKQLEYQKVSGEYENGTPGEKRAVKASEYEMVKRDLDKVIELAPDFVYAYYNRGNVYSLMKDYRAALVDYDKTIELDPKLADAYYNRGLTHIFLGNNRQGIQDLSKAGELGLFSAYNIIKRFTEIKE
ncbi:tetratricopeptide repeat protein [Phocaeicola sp.]